MFQILRLTGAICGAALVMLAWSEFVFYNEGPVAKLTDALALGGLQTIGFIAEMGVFYMIPSAFLVGLVGLFGGHGAARLLLIGALTGYAIEGAVVPAVYEAVPFSYLWTSIAWHGPITVALGVFVLPRLMSQASAFGLVLISSALGLCWGIWTTWIWADDAFMPISAEMFARYAAVSAATMFVGYGLLFWSGWPSVTPPKWVSYALIVPTLALFVLQGVAVPLAALGLLAILGLLVSVLCRWGHAPADAYAARPVAFAILAIMPVIASLVYLYLLEAGPPIAPDDLVALTFAVGLGVWVVGVGLGFRKSRRLTEQP